MDNANHNTLASFGWEIADDARRHRQSAIPSRATRTVFA
jgi:hypothetical protein